MESTKTFNNPKEVRIKGNKNMLRWIEKLWDDKGQ